MTQLFSVQIVLTKYIYLAPSGIAITMIARDAHHCIFQIFSDCQQSTNRTI